MLLGRKPHTAGNHKIFEVDYDQWLADGDSLTAATVVLSSAFTATVTDVSIATITVKPRHFYFTLIGGAVNETFTLDVQATDSRGEIKKDTLGFTVVAP